jgi:Cu(I)/Ag(I) efflux system membrane fusion protein
MRNKFVLLILAVVLLGVPACSKKSAPPSPAEKKIIFYRNPMDPKVTSPVAMKDDMGMDYLPVYEGENESAVPVAGQATVKVAPERQQLIGMTVAPVELRDLTMAIRASARVAYDPNLYSAILEHQQALAALPKDDSNQRVQAEASSLVRASKLRLRQMGLSDEQIKEVSRPGFDPSNLLLSKAGGRVWVYIDIYDFEAPAVKAGQKADLTSSASPGKTYEATVRAVDTVVNSETRTLRARAEVVNTDGALRPEMYLNAVIHVPSGRKLAVPESAVVDTGTRQLVYVEKSPGEFEPRAVTLGKKAEGFYEVISGVEEGERVVTSANFLIDSESKLKAAIQGK